MHHRPLLLAFALILPFLPSVSTAYADGVEVHYARSEDIDPILLNQINGSTQSIYLLMYSFTDPALAQALVAARQRGVDVRVVLDSSEAKTKSSMANYLIQNLGTIDTANGPVPRAVLGHGLGSHGIMHEKQAVYDGNRISTGSYNWTENARKDNWEVLYLLSNPGNDMIAAADQQFNAVFNYALQNPVTPTSYTEP